MSKIIGGRTTVNLFNSSVKNQSYFMHLGRRKLHKPVASRYQCMLTKDCKHTLAKQNISNKAAWKKTAATVKKKKIKSLGHTSRKSDNSRLVYRWFVLGGAIW